MTAPYQWPKQLFRSPDDWGDYRFLFTEAVLKSTIAFLKERGGGFESISESKADVFELEEIGPDKNEALYSQCFVGLNCSDFCTSEWIKVSNSNANPVIWQEGGFADALPVYDTFHYYDPEDPEDVENFRSKGMEHN